MSFQPTKETMMNYGNSSSAQIAGAGAQYATQAPQQIGMIEGIDSELNISLKGLHECISQARSIADRLFGTQPEAVRGGNVDPKATTQAGRLESTAGYLRESVNELRQQMLRFERL